MNFRIVVLTVLVAAAAAQEPLPDKPRRTQDPSARPASQESLPYASAALQWFPVIEQSLVLPAREEHSVAVYRFENPRAARIEWRQLVGSCTCSQAVVVIGERRYELRAKVKKVFQIAPVETPVAVESIPIEAGEKGTVELHVEMKGINGIRVVSLDIHTTDPEVPMMRLHYRAAHEQPVVVTPADINLGTIDIGEKRPLIAKVSALARDFAITGARPLPTGVTADFERVGKGETVCWLIRGDCSWSTPGNVSAVLKFDTNSKEVPVLELKVRASVRALVEARPPVFSLGRVAVGKGGSARVELTRGDGQKMAATALRFEGVNIDTGFFAVRSFEEGGSLVIELTVAADAPKGLLRGEVVVELDHPAVEKHRLPFSGFVR